LNNLSKGTENTTKQQLLTEILLGLKEKFIQPLVNENKRLAVAINQKAEKDDKIIQELIERVDRLEKKLEENPVTVLSAIRDAINQSNGGKENGSD